MCGQMSEGARHDVCGQVSERPDSSVWAGERGGARHEVRESDSNVWAVE